ncbi:RAMP superfamily protein [Fontimonas thermophila]|uniref:RAMP superfamily protein n=1 Tax=Fontimonas thermophila TaxID=1076937 RepID=A0A1I2J3L2_9GAMM|nr:type III-B CRISPR module RAMP protein Cmr6 [Fontimonas thermophila]SFF47526.1 RAMP superfamily protein [Fontimonas thermophila]
MPIAAVPAYMGQDFKDASPGMRFGMCLKLWGINRRTRALLWQTYDLDYEVRGQARQEREVKVENKTSALTDARCLCKADRDRLSALAARQAALVQFCQPESLLCLHATATAPFTTGLGNEHPLENGFSFLWPYGLPYLPGSGVKGVLRRAAQELAQGLWENARGWGGFDQPAYEIEIGSGKNKSRIRLSVLDVLFGREPLSGDSNAVRGVLSFWDVIPDIKGDSLMVEIMTPHQSHYYQWKKDHRDSLIPVNPHDSGQPTPIAFLTVPPGSRFAFHVVCDMRHLKQLTQNRTSDAPDLLEITNGRPRWQVLLEAAFGHAFAWLGFGAKTAVGYGAMQRDQEAEAERKVQADERARAAQCAAMTEAQRAIQDFCDYMQKRYEQLRGRPVRPNGEEHNRARRLVQAAQGWSTEDRCAAADAVEEWLPKVVQVDIKDERKKLGLNKLRSTS